MCLSATVTGDSPRVRQFASEHLIQHDADAVEIRSFVQFVALRLFRRNVVDASHDQARLGQRHRVLRNGASDPEVGEFHDVVFGDENVRRFDVAVQQAGAVRVRKTAANLRCVVDRDRLGKFAVGS